MPSDDDAAPSQPAPRLLRTRLNWQRLGGGWVALALLVGVGGGVLQWLGPPSDGARPRSGPGSSGPGSAPARATPGPGTTRDAAVSGDATPRTDAAAGQGPAGVATAPTTTAPPPVLYPSGGARDRREPAQAASGSSAPNATAGSPTLGGSAAGSSPPAAEHPATPAAPLAAEPVTPGGPPPRVAGAQVAGSGTERSVEAAPTGPRSAASPVPTPASAAPVVIAAPLAALLEPAADGLALPRIGADGLAPMQAYARPFQAPPGARLVAIVLDGIGLSEADSQAAINALPGEVDLAVSPYAPRPEALLRQARLKGHELLASIPMEPAGAPLNDEGGRALTIDATPEANEANLAWVLGRIQGYVGATGGSDGQRGEHFALSGRPFAAVAESLAARGLLYLDAAGARVPFGLASRGVDLVVDEPAGAAALDARLARLETMAQENGVAVGLAGPPRPVTVERIAAWAKGLASRGLVLAPVSALVRTGRAAPPTAGQGGAAPGVPDMAAPVPHGQAADGSAGASQARRAP